MKKLIFLSLCALLLIACEKNEPSSTKPIETEQNSGNNGGSGNSNPPTAQFSYTVRQPLMVDFVNESTESPTDIVWDFGDSFTSNQLNPQHTYSEIGTYKVTLTVSNASGKSSCWKSVTIQAPKVFVSGIQYNKVGKENMYYRAKCEDDDIFTTTWWTTGYTSLVSSSNLPLKYQFVSPVEMNGLKEDDYYTIFVYWNNKTNGDGTQILKQKMYTSDINKYPVSITLTNDNKDTQVSILFSYQ